jgi:methylamine dehydrogenase accessory protein MauD
MNDMGGIWLISFFMLWFVVIFLLLAVGVLSRQVGLLHRRLGAPNARMTNSGPEVGESAPELSATDLMGREVTLASNRGRQTLMVFVSASCPACNELMPSLRSIWHSERNSLEVILVSLSLDEKMNRSFVLRHKLEDIPYVVSKEIGTRYAILTSPYGLLIDHKGIVRAKGVINHLEHLESLLDAAQLGFPSMESWVQAQQSQKMAMAMDSPSQ